MTGEKKCPNCHTKMLEFTADPDDYIRCPACGSSIGINALRIKIVKIPEGPAPPKIREAWLGLELVAKATPLKGPEVDFSSGDMIVREPAIMVFKEMALEMLEKKSPEAAAWFHTNLPAGMEHLTFGPDEVDVVEKICILDTD